MLSTHPAYSNEDCQRCESCDWPVDDVAFRSADGLLCQSCENIRLCKDKLESLTPNELLNIYKDGLTKEQLVKDILRRIDVDAYLESVAEKNTCERVGRTG